MVLRRQLNKGILDVVPGAVAAFSLSKLSNLYDGAGIQLRKRVGGSTDFHQDFYFSGYELDWAEIENWAADADNGELFVSAWYDQSGLDNHCTNVIADEQPFLNLERRRIYNNEYKYLDFTAIINKEFAFWCDIQVLQNDNQEMRFVSRNAIQPYRFSIRKLVNTNTIKVAYRDDMGGLKSIDIFSFIEEYSSITMGFKEPNFFIIKTRNNEFEYEANDFNTVFGLSNNFRLLSYFIQTPAYDNEIDITTIIFYNDIKQAEKLVYI